MLSINNISKNFGATRALKNITLHLSGGKCLGLVGPNGAGKSSLIKIIVGIMQNDAGSIEFETIRKQNIGYVPQEICLEENVSALQNLYFFGEVYYLTGKALQTRAEEVLAYIGLTERKKDKVKTFSGGMKRRLNIGCALMNKPRLIMMDEPTVGIDPQSRQYILTMIDHMKKENCTIIYSSHYIEEVEKICDDVAFIDKGEIIEQNNIEYLLQNHAIPTIFFTCKDNDTVIKDIQSIGTVKRYKSGYIIKTRNPMQAMEKILQICRKNKIGLDQLELVKPRLEDVFFSLTGSELRA